MKKLILIAAFTLPASAHILWNDSDVSRTVHSARRGNVVLEPGARVMFDDTDALIMLDKGPIPYEDLVKAQKRAKAAKGQLDSKL